MNERFTAQTAANKQHQLTYDRSRARSTYKHFSFTHKLYLDNLIQILFNLKKVMSHYFKVREKMLGPKNDGFIRVFRQK